MVKLRCTRQEAIEVEVETPFYFAWFHDHSATYVRLTENQLVYLRESNDRMSYEIEVLPPTSFSLSSHPGDCEITRDNFEKAFCRFQTFLVEKIDVC